MRFRPCIDIHNGKVKQIVGSTLRDEGDRATENFVAQNDAAYYARLYKDYDLTGGHVIILNGAQSEYFEASRQQAVAALKAFPGGMMLGGGVNADNAKEYIDAGASHVIVTSYVFSDGIVNMDNLEALTKAVGKNHTVLDLSCGFVDGSYHVLTNRWQTASAETVDEALFERLMPYADEFLVHAVDSEGHSAGIDERLVAILSGVDAKVCYAGGISSYDDIRRIRDTGRGKVDFTVGSRLEIFGGNLSIKEIIECTR